jgi:troponin T
LSEYIYFFFEIIFIDSDGLRQKASDLWDTIIRLETEKYDIEEKQKRQNYDVSYFLIYLKSQIIEKDEYYLSLC